jgi:CheY-specific phosphatase CheX
MPGTLADLRGVLAQSVGEVLEKMFFSEASEPGPKDRSIDRGICARVRFAGSPSGTCWLVLAEPCARTLAADFLGIDEESVGAGQCGEIVAELANMICGSVVSRIESESRFELSPPGFEVAAGPGPEAAEVRFALESGGLWAAVELDAEAEVQ